MADVAGEFFDLGEPGGAPGTVLSAGFFATPLAGSVVYFMRARASDTGTRYIWTVVGQADFAGASYPGTGTPQQISVAGTRFL